MRIGSVCLMLAMGLGTSAWATTYTVQDLGSLSYNQSSTPTAINSAGTVVGFSYVQDGGWNYLRGFKYSGGAMTSIGTFPGGYSSFARDINSQGQVAGYATRPDLGWPYERAFIITNGTWADITPSDYYMGSWAYGINNSGKAVGSFETGLGNQAFAYDPGAPTKWTTFGLGAARAINDSGLIVGYSTGAVAGSNKAHAAFMAPGDITLLDYDYTNQRFLADQSWAYDINSAGQAVGAFIGDSSSGDTHAFIYAGSGLTDLGTLGGRNAQALAINSLGQVVGSSSTAGSELNDGPTHGFLYSNGAMVDLNALIDPDSGFTILDASGINDSGWIIAQGEQYGQLHAVLLTPVPDPAGLSILGTVLLLACGRRRSA